MTTGDIALIIALAVAVLAASNLPSTWRRQPVTAADGGGLTALVDQLGAQRDEIRQLKAEIEQLKARLTEAELRRDALNTELEAWRRGQQRITELENENEGLRRAITRPAQEQFMAKRGS